MQGHCRMGLQEKTLLVGARNPALVRLEHYCTNAKGPSWRKRRGLHKIWIGGHCATRRISLSLSLSLVNDGGIQKPQTPAVATYVLVKLEA